MLTHLSIRNIVLIEQAEIDFGKGLCVLTGETGAGKSILLGALGLVLGERAEARLLRQGSEQGSATAEFDITKNENAKEVLSELGMEADDTLFIRRTLAADGKSRCFINDAPVTQAALKKLGSTLVEIHGQHDQRGLLDHATHRSALDGFGRLGKQVEAVESAYAGLSSARQALTRLDEEIAQAQREQDYLRHMRSELAALDPKPGEEETLSDKRTRMMQSEKTFELVQDVRNELGAGKGVDGMLRSAQRLLTRSPLASGTAFAALIEQLEKAAVEADEAVAQLDVLAQDTVYDPQELETIEERLFALRAAGRKYNLPVDELPALKAQVEAKIHILDDNEAQRKRLSVQLEQCRKEYVAAAEMLSESRKKIAVKLEKTVAAELAPLKMENTKLKITVEPLPENQWAAHGSDAVAFVVATNVTSKDTKDFAPLSKIASGGELSRFMLAMKVSMAEVRMTPTLIFDEIDTGTGGAVADAIGRRLADLGQQAQVLVVTHLPQVAARGSMHLRVAKEEKKGRVTTDVDKLDMKQRCEEVARMLAGATITAEARKAAQKLLDEAA